jgi:predicted metal-dependent peptidase
MTMAEADMAALRAEGKIKLGIDRLAGRYPFHAAVLGRFRLRARPEVATMGVAVDGDAIPLYFNPEFVLAVSVDELQGVLLHEVHHVVLGHVLADPADFPDAWARTVAEEVSANEFITEPLPGNPVTLADFPALPPMESTRRRYDRLRQIPKPQRTPIGHLLDDHAVWAEARDDPDRSRQAIREAVEEAALEAGPDRVPECLASAVEALGVGLTPGSDWFRARGRGRGELDWRRQLRRYTGRALEERPVFNRPPRRFPELVGILPGRRRQATRPRIMAVIDTSGSMSDALLEQVDAELARLGRRSEVLVVECDAAIHGVYRHRKGVLGSFRGRGGTDFRPPLEAEFLRRHRPNLIIYFTDGYGPAPRAAPRIPVIWCLTPRGQSPAPWGRVISMQPLNKLMA